LRDATGNRAEAGTFLFNNHGVLQRFTLSPTSLMPEGPGELQSDFFSATVRHEFSAARYLRIDGSYYHIPSYQFRQPAAGATEVAGPGSVTDGSRKSYHLNAQYQFATSGNNLTIGAETRHDMAENGSYRLANWFVKDLRQAQTFAALGRSINQSTYVQDQIAMTERLNVVLGARYDYWKGYDGQSNSFNAARPPTAYPERSNHKVTAKAALAYSLPQDWNLRLSAGTAFRNPNVFDLYATSVSASGFISQSNPFLKPESLTSWEVGARKRFGNRTDFDVAYYENYITDLIYRQTDLAADPSGRVRVNVNAGRGRTRGLEGAFRQTLVPGLQFRATYTYTGAVITENPASPATVGKRVTFIPAHVTSGQLLAIRGKWTMSLAGRYVGTLYGSDTNDDRTKGVPAGYDPFFMTDANVGYNVNPKVQVLVTGENLLNRRYYAFYLSPGRTVYAGLRIRL
jgi:iron complex outermembrane receptor protein